jgi:cytochrome c oxidase subunit III
MAAVSSTPGVPHRAPSIALFGTILFLASELLFFGGLFAAYFGIRAHAPEWPPADAHVEPLTAGIATVLLVLSSFTLHAGVVAGRRADFGRFRLWVLVSIALGITFLAIQGWEYTQLDFAVSSHAYGTLFYGMTGFHGLHVAAGVLAMLAMLWLMAPEVRETTRIEAAEGISLYWHFVDVVWIGLFATLYLVR